MKGPRTAPELVAAVRRCAEAGMSGTEAAEELSTQTHPLTRSAVLGIAQRNGIGFKSVRRGTPKPHPKHKPRVLRLLRRTVAPAKPATQEAVVQPAPIARSVFIAPPRPECSWAGCALDAEPGNMFCLGHGRRGLM